MFLPDSILALELTDHCNCRCRMCSQSVQEIIHGSSKGFMDEGLLESILEDLVRHGARLDKLLPFGLGESTVHPRCRQMLARIFAVNATEHLFSQIDLHTNAIALGEELQELLVRHGNQLGSLTFSLDAARAETHRTIRGSHGFEAARSHVMEFLRRRKRQGSSRPTVILQFIVMPENVHDAAPFLQFWQRDLASLGLEFQVNWDWDPPMVRDTIFFKRVNPFGDFGITEAEALHRRTVEQLGLLPPTAAARERLLDSDEHLPTTAGPRRPCSGPFKYVNVAWDGTVTVCCIDTARRLALGRITPETPLCTLWEGESNRRLRRAHILGDLRGYPVCAACRNLDGPRISDAELIDWLRCNRDGEGEAIFRRRMGIAE